MKLHRLALVFGLGAGVACVASQRDPGQSPAPAEAVPSLAGVDPDLLGANPPTRTLASSRVMDWSSQRHFGRATYGMSAADAVTAMTPMAAPLANWTVQTGGAVTAAPAMLGGDWNTGSAYDTLFFAVNGSGAGVGITAGATTTSTGSNFFALTRLYAASPTIAWSVALPASVDRNAVTLSLDGKKVFVLDSSGTLRCYQTAWVSAGDAGTLGGSPTACSGWTNYQNSSCVSAGQALNGTTFGVNGSSPWLDYKSATSDLYFGDNCGYVNHVNGVTGAKVWSVKLGPTTALTAAFQSSPVVLNGTLYIGDDMGRLFKVLNASSTTAPVQGSTSILKFDACSAEGYSAPCPGWTTSTASPWAIRAPIGYDVFKDNVYSVSNDYMFELPGTAATFVQSANSPKKLNSGGTGPMYAAPVTDATNKFIYTQLNGKLFKISYPFAGTATTGVYTTTLANTAHPSLSSPLPYNGKVYVGDGSGIVESFDCNSAAGAAQLDGVTSTNTAFGGGNGVTTGIGLDNRTGNVLFGFATVNAGTGAIGGPGGIAQFPQTSGTAYVCPTTAAHLCTGTCLPGGGGDACRECCSSADCGGNACNNGKCQLACTGSGAGNCALPTGANATVACTASKCVYSCNSGFTSCAGDIQNLGCVNTQTDPNNCGGCGTACPTNNIPVPSCTLGVCSGACADGFVDCDGSSGNRGTNGCETAASCGGCCGATLCTPGTICADPGYNVSSGRGQCLTPGATQVIQQCGTAVQGSSATVSCPAGQPIKTITFADYGSPSGTCGQSTSICTTLATSALCTAVSGCAWNTASGSCIPSACSTLTTLATCNANTACAWDTAIASCVGALGFRHYYGTSPNNKFSPNCAQDISAAPIVTGTCVGNNSCALDVANDVYGTSGTAPVAGTTTLPLTPACGSGSDCASNPCPGISKAIYAQVGCGACQGKRIFVGTFGSTGSFGSGGIKGIDANVCMAAAVTAGLKGTYKAWVGNASDGSAATRLAHANMYYMLPSGTPVAAGWTALVSGTLLHAIDQHADQSSALGLGIWTGTKTDGSIDVGKNCSDFTTTAGTGTIGQAGQTDSRWTQLGLQNCTSGFGFYCIEQ